jgi:phage gp29-like protein
MKLLSRLLRTRTLQKQNQPPTQPLALPGTSALGGYILRIGEYNPKLQGNELFKTVDQMRNNARILALEYLLTLPIIATHWEVRPPNNPTITAKEATDLLNYQLFQHSQKDLYDILRLAILARFYGIRLIEPIWHIENNLALINDYIDLHPATYYKFHFDERGNLTHITQRVQHPQTATLTEITIPTERLIRFTWREEGGNPLGYSDLRSLYPDWYRLEFLYTILQIAAERAGIGAWQAKIPRDLWDNDNFRNAVHDILKRIRTHEAGALVIPTDVSIEVLQAIDRQGIDGILKMVEHYETNLAAGVLANILQVGMKDIGTQALAEVLFDMFLYQLNQTARWLASTLNAQLIRKFLSYNYPQLPPQQHPTLHFTDLRLLLKRESVVNAIAQVTQSGAIQPDPNLEDYLRDILSLPPPTKQNNLNNNHLATSPNPHTITLQRQPRNPEETFHHALQSYIQTIEQTITPKIQDAITQIRNAHDEHQRALAIAQLQTIELPARSQYETLIYDYLRHFATEARAALQQQYNLNIKPNELPESFNQFLLAKAQTLARDHYEHLRSQLIYTALSEALRHTPILQPHEIVRNITSQRLNTDLQTLHNEANTLLEHINQQLNNTTQPPQP